MRVAPDALDETRRELASLKESLAAAEGARQQIDRARHAVDHRIGLMVRTNAPFDISPALATLLDREKREDMAARGEEFSETVLATNGAKEISELVAELAGSSIIR